MAWLRLRVVLFCPFRRKDRVRWSRSHLRPRFSSQARKGTPICPSIGMRNLPLAPMAPGQEQRRPGHRDCIARTCTVFALDDDGCAPTPAPRSPVHHESRRYCGNRYCRLELRLDTGILDPRRWRIYLFIQLPTRTTNRSVEIATG